jgi:hypothetical protein
MAILTVGAVLVAACDGGGSGHPSRSSGAVPSTGSSTAPSLSPSPSRTGPLTTGPGVQPGEKPPVLDAEAKQHTATGALTLAEYFVQALDWSAATTDPYLLKQISASTCEACQLDITQLEALAADGAHVRGGRTRIVSDRLVTGDFTIKSDYVVEIVTHDDAIVIVRPTASPSTSVPGVERDKSLVFVSWLGGRWQIVGEGAPS